VPARRVVSLGCFGATRADRPIVVSKRPRARSLAEAAFGTDLRGNVQVPIGSELFFRLTQPQNKRRESASAIGGTRGCQNDRATGTRGFEAYRYALIFRSATYGRQEYRLRSASDGHILTQMAEERKKNPAAVALGRLGGRKRAATLSTEERSEQGKRAAAARWARSKSLEAPLEIQKPSLEKSERAMKPVREAEANFEGHDSNAIQALRDQGYEVGEPALHPDDVMRVNVRSHDVSAWVTTGKELLDLAAERVTLEEIMNRRRSEQRSVAAGGPG
jgi:hypothetical protein